MASAGMPTRRRGYGAFGPRIEIRGLARFTFRRAARANMSYLRKTELGADFAPFASFREHFGFVPNLFHAQTALPRVIEAEAGIAATVLLKQAALSRIQKEHILLRVAAAHHNTYCVTAHHHMLRSLGVPESQLNQIMIDHHRANISAADVALLDFALMLGKHSPWISREDIVRLRNHGFTDESVLEAILVTGLTNFLCTLSVGVGPAPDFEPKKISFGETSQLDKQSLRHDETTTGPYLRAVEYRTATCPPFAFFQEQFGFVPNIFRAQTLRPDVLEAEAGVIRAVLLTEDLLSRVQKECILLVISAANLNTYCVAVHCEMLRALGVSVEDSDQIAVDHHQTDLSEADKALLDFARKLAVRPSEFRLEDVGLLRRQGLCDERILEGVVMTALTNFLNTLQMGLGTTPDFLPKRVFAPKDSHPFSSQSRPISDAAPSEDPDADLVSRVQNGDVHVFAELIRRHSRRVFGVLAGIVGNMDDVRDATQEVFLKAFEHIDRFQGRSKFSTWLISITINTGTELLRQRKPSEPLEEVDEEEGFRPRQIQSWAENPEQLFAASQRDELVRTAVLRLPEKYRVVVLLRDIQQLSTEEAASALDLSIPALKARLVRGRLMLRESLAQHFIRTGNQES
jgi:RNA polymerase sigma-70 factor, ECF subfamily